MQHDKVQGYCTSPILHTSFKARKHVCPALSLFLSSTLQAIPPFKAYWLGTSISEMPVGHHYDFEFVLRPGPEPKVAAQKGSMLITTPNGAHSCSGLYPLNELPL